MENRTSPIVMRAYWGICQAMCTLLAITSSMTCGLILSASCRNAQKRTLGLAPLRALLAPRSTRVSFSPAWERPCRPLRSPAGPGRLSESCTWHLNIYSAAVQRRETRKGQVCTFWMRFKNDASKQPFKLIYVKLILCNGIINCCCCCCCHQQP